MAEAPSTPTSPRTYPHGVPCWVDLEVDDLDAAQDFYAELLGWSFTDAMPPQAPGSYLIATVGGRDVAAIGSLDLATPGSAPQWATYLAVDDADTTAAQVEAAGGAVTSDPADAGPGGRAASCTDSRGVPFRLWQARRRLGAQHVNAPGGWNFSDLLVADEPGAADAATSFYSHLFGWRVARLWEGSNPWLFAPGYGAHLAATSDPGIHERQAFAPEDFADAIGGVEPVVEGDHPRWRVTFTVDDRDVAAATAERLGATVLRSADRRFARTADLRDPLGAELTISQFTGPSGS